MLNVWTPAADGRRRPVMFYSHGGGYVGGSGGSRGQDGSNLARRYDVVVVETNHRLGLFGFLYLDEVAGEAYAGSGNNGTLDLVDGLRWVQQNIAAFGGDPANVMIFGESGGGGKTSCLYAMPSAAPYFNKASIESGPGVRMTTREAAAETTAFVLKELNIGRADWRKLLDVPTADLLAIQAKLPPVPPDPTVRPRGRDAPATRIRARRRWRRTAESPRSIRRPPRFPATSRSWSVGTRTSTTSSHGRATIPVRSAWTWMVWDKADAALRRGYGANRRYLPGEPAVGFPDGHLRRG